MNIDWQNVAVTALVIAAGGYLAWRGWLIIARKTGGGCGSGCSSCDVKQSPEGTQRPFVPVEKLMDSQRDSQGKSR